MSGNKTVATDQPVAEYIAALADPKRKRECELLLPLMNDATGLAPRMWGPSIIGYGHYAYTYESGRSGEFFRIGFAPRKAAMTIYIMPGFNSVQPLLKKLGPHSLGRSCLYIKRLDAIDLKVLVQIVRTSLEVMAKLYPPSD